LKLFLRDIPLANEDATVGISAGGALQAASHLEVEWVYLSILVKDF
jgi:hypothetical protein